MDIKVSLIIDVKGPISEVPEGTVYEDNINDYPNPRTDWVVTNFFGIEGSNDIYSEARLWLETVVTINEDDRQVAEKLVCSHYPSYNCIPYEVIEYYYAIVEAN